MIGATAEGAAFTTGTATAADVIGGGSLSSGQMLAVANSGGPRCRYAMARVAYFAQKADGVGVGWHSAP